MKWFRHFLADVRGNFAVTAAVALVPLLGAGGLAVDFASVHHKKSELQELADGAALAVSKEMSLSKLTDKQVSTLVENFVLANFRAGAGETLQIVPAMANDSKSLKVDLALVWKPFFAHYLDSTVLPLRVSSTAAFYGERANICVLALNSSEKASIGMNDPASVTAQGCAIYSDSTSASGIDVSNGATISGDAIFTAGGFNGPINGFNQKPITDSPPVGDPLSGRPEPAFGGCEYNNYFADSGSITLFPGVYCGGISLSGKVEARLEPGEYIIRDGPLLMKGNATLTGKFVGFYLTGTNAIFHFSTSTQVDLIAPKSGPLAGILFFEDRASPKGRTFTIESKDAERFEGVVYLPRGTLFIDKASKVGTLANWTAIIADRIMIGEGPQILVKADYGASEIPVPSGIGGTSRVKLVN